MKNKTISIVLLLILACSLILSFSSIENARATANQGGYLAQPMYLTNLSSDVAPFYNITTSIPGGTTNQTLNVHSGTGDTDSLIAGWMLPPGWNPNIFNFNFGYNFLFSIAANKTTGTSSDGHLFARLGLCNNNNASACTELNVLREDMQSNSVPMDIFQILQWEERVESGCSINSSQRLFINVYLHANGSGTWYISFYSSTTPSYFQDPVETRYMTSYFYDGISSGHGYNLSTTNSIISASSTKVNSTFYYGAALVGIKVWHNNTEITSGTPVAQVQVYDGDSHITYNNTWSCPSTNVQSTEYINVTVFVQFGTYWYVLGTATFRSEVLAAQSLDSSTWNVFYVLSLLGDFVHHRTTVSINFGSSGFNSRIENFLWTAAQAGGEYDLFGTIVLNQAVYGKFQPTVNLMGSVFLNQALYGFLTLQPLSFIYLFGKSLMNLEILGNLRLLATGGAINLFGKIVLNFLTDMSGTELSWSNEMIFAWVIVLVFILIPAFLLLLMVLRRKR